MKHSKIRQIKMIRVCKLTKYLPAVAAIDFLEKEKDLGTMRLKLRETQSSRRTRRNYSVYLVLEEGKDVIGKKSELISVNDLINPQIYVAGVGNIRQVDCK